MMKTLKFHFCHPVKGTVKLLNRQSPGLNRMQPFATNGGDIAQVNIAGLPEGQWKAELEWEHDGKDYLYERDFVVNNLFK